MFTIQKPVFTYNALEPFIDEATMHVHVDKHHQAYADKLNAALTEHTDLQNASLEDLVKSEIPVIKNMAGGVLNHNLFWTMLSADIDQAIPAALDSLLTANFGSSETFKTQFTEAATKLFGSGWTWLVSQGPGTKDQGLKIISTPNQDSPITQGLIPLLGIDVWEHAYYLKYQNRRPEYIEAFWHVVNWEQVAQNLT